MPGLGSIRQRFLMAVLCGAVLPMAVAGAFLAQSSVRSAEGLLRAQLDTALSTIAGRMERRWDYRRGDLLMLAGNDVVVRSMTDHAPPATAIDSAYIARLHASLSSTIPYLRFRTNDGTVRWQFGMSAPGIADGRRGGGGAPSPDPRLVLKYPVHAEGAPPLGTLEAEVRLTAVLPVDSIPILLNGASLTVADGRTGLLLALPGLANAPIDGSTFVVNGERWLSQHRTVAESLLIVTAAAPTRDYVAPFKRSARIGLLVLIGVVLLSLALSVYFTSRITRSIERLASAADAVARGDLGRNVETNGDDEVGRLAHSFNTMTDSLRRTLRELSQKEALAAVGEFATSLSHEVRNGLTAVRVDLERADESGPNAPESPALVSRALRNVLRLNSTVTGALSVARSGRAMTQPVDLHAVLLTAATAAESAFRASGSSLVTPHDSPTVHLRGDPVSLEQLFLNLLLNAGQAMTRGGVAHLEVHSIGGDCVVSLRDSGPGMPADLLASAEPYVSSKRGGTGLGLSIARKIAEAHGGSLHLENAASGGFVASVRLPKSDSSPLAS